MRSHTLYSFAASLAILLLIPSSIARLYKRPAHVSTVSTLDRSEHSFLFAEDGNVLFISPSGSPAERRRHIYTVTLSGVDNNIIYFSDRPNRITGFIPASQFSQLFKPGNQFAKISPNAVITGVNAKRQTVRYVGELLHSVYEAHKKRQIFKVRFLDPAYGELHDVYLKNANVFVDNVFKAIGHAFQEAGDGIAKGVGAAVKGVMEVGGDVAGGAVIAFGRGPAKNRVQEAEKEENIIDRKAGSVDKDIQKAGPIIGDVLGAEITTGLAAGCDILTVGACAVESAGLEAGVLGAEVAGTVAEVGATAGEAAAEVGETAAEVGETAAETAEKAGETAEPGSEESSQALQQGKNVNNALKEEGNESLVSKVQEKVDDAQDLYCNVQGLVPNAPNLPACQTMNSSDPNQQAYEYTPATQLSTQGPYMNEPGYYPQASQGAEVTPSPYSYEAYSPQTPPYTYEGYSTPASPMEESPSYAGQPNSSAYYPSTVGVSYTNSQPYSQSYYGYGQTPGVSYTNEPTYSPSYYGTKVSAPGYPYQEAFGPQNYNQEVAAGQ